MDIPPLVSPQWLHDNLSHPDVQVIESGWITDGYSKAHISGALSSPRHPHLKKVDAGGERSLHLLEAAEFSDFCRNLGLRRDRHYVIYDDFSGLFAARCWWVCRYFGVHNISILDGSWRGWLDQQKPVSSRLETPLAGTDIHVAPHLPQLIGREELQRLYRDPQVQLWDTRREGEYTGEEDTDNQRRGHVPGALNLVWTDLLTEAPFQGGPRFFKSVAELEELLTNLGLRRDKTIIPYCQAGIRAAFCVFVLELLGYPHHRLYDASMREWANRSETPLITGANP